MAKLSIVSRIRPVIIIELMILSFLGDCKPAAATTTTRSSENITGDQIAQEQRLALHIITSSIPEQNLQQTRDTRSLNENGSKTRSKLGSTNQPNQVVNYDDTMEPPQYGTFTNKPTMTIGQSQRSASVKRIVINLNHPMRGKNGSNHVIMIGKSPLTVQLANQQTGNNNQSSPQAHVPTAMNDLQSAREKKTPNTRQTINNDSSRLKTKASETNKQKLINEESIKRKPRMREVIMHRVRQQGGIPALIVEDESHLMDAETKHPKREKLMLQSEMVDDMTNGDSNQLDSSGSQRESFIDLENQSGESNLSATSDHTSGESQSQMIVKQQKSPPDSDDGQASDGQQLEVSDATNNEATEQNNNGLDSSRASVDLNLRSKPSKDNLGRMNWLRRNRGKKPNDAQERPIQAPANERQLSWKSNNHRADDYRRRDTDNRKFVYNLEPENDATDSDESKDTSDNDNNELISYRIERNSHPQASDKAESDNDSADNELDRNVNYSKNVRDPQHRKEPVKLVRVNRRLTSAPKKSSSSKNIDRSPQLDHGDFPSANAVRIHVAVDESNPSSSSSSSSLSDPTLDNKRQEQKHQQQEIGRHKSASSQKKQVTREKSDGQDSVRLNNRVTTLLERLRLYTTRDQLMKVANELQQYPDKREATEMNDNEQNEPPKTLGTTNRIRQQASHMIPSPLLSQSNRNMEHQLVPESIRNHVPAPLLPSAINEENFLNSLDTSASKESSSQEEDDSNTNNKQNTDDSVRAEELAAEEAEAKNELRNRFLNRKVELRSGMNTQPEVEAEGDYDNTLMRNTDQNHLNLHNSNGEPELSNNEKVYQRGEQHSQEMTDEYTNNGDLLNTMEANERSYNAPNNNEDDGHRSINSSSEDSPMPDDAAATATNSINSNDRSDDQESTARNDQEEDEIRILERVIDELVAAERDRKFKEQSSDH